MVSGMTKFSKIFNRHQTTSTKNQNTSTIVPTYQKYNPDPVQPELAEDDDKSNPLSLPLQIKPSATIPKASGARWWRPNQISLSRRSSYHSTSNTSNNHHHQPPAPTVPPSPSESSPTNQSSSSSSFRNVIILNSDPKKSNPSSPKKIKSNNLSQEHIPSSSSSSIRKLSIRQVFGISTGSQRPRSPKSSDGHSQPLSLVKSYSQVLICPEPEQEVLQSSKLLISQDQPRAFIDQNFTSVSPTSITGPGSTGGSQLVSRQSTIQVENEEGSSVVVDRATVQAQEDDEHQNNRSNSTRNPLQILSSRIKAGRSKVASDVRSVRRSRSSNSLAERPDHTQNDQPSSSVTPGPSTDNLGSFQLKSFRNVRSTPGSPSPQPISRSESSPSPSNPRPVTMVANPSNPIYNFPRPVSPSPRISAAAFREAQDARRSRSSFTSSNSDQILSLDTTTPNPHGSSSDNNFYVYQNLSAIRPSSDQSNRARSDIGHGTPRARDSSRPKKGAANGNSRRTVTTPLIYQIPSRSQQGNPSGQQTSLIPPFDGVDPNMVFHEHDILVPPRPAFYGSRPAVRSHTSDQRQSMTLDTRSRQSRLGSSPNRDVKSLYSQEPASGSRLSVRSLPSASNPPDQQRQRSRNRSGTTASKAPPTELDQWHSDEEDESGTNPRPQSTRNKVDVPPLPPLPPASSSPQRSNRQVAKKAGKQSEREDAEEEDEVPLSMLKKKSATSIRDLAAAQTLAKGRQQLHQNFEPPLPASISSFSALSTEAPLFAPLASAYQFNPGRDSFMGTAQPNLANGLENGLQLPIINQTMRPPSISHISVENYPRMVAGPHPSMVGPMISKEGFLGPLPLIPNPRGNSPVSSSSGGSGSGSWSLPLTPRDSTGNAVPPTAMNMTGSDGAQMKGRVGFESSSFLDKEPPSRLAKSTMNGSRGNHRSHDSIDSLKSRTGKSVKSQGREVSIDDQKVSPGLAENHPQFSMMGWGGMGVGIEDLGVPTGVDPYLYSGLTNEQKIQLHQRSQMMMQMMAVQTQQMHALALSQQSGMMMGYNMTPMGWPNSMGGMIGNGMVNPGGGGSQIGVEPVNSSSVSTFSLPARNKINNANSVMGGSPNRRALHHQSVSQCSFTSSPLGGGARNSGGK